MASKKLLEAIAVTAELTNTTLSEAAARVFANDLSEFPERSVLAALDRCRKECKGRLTLYDVISRIDDGRPGVEEAWSMVPWDELTTTVWTDEVAEAFGVAQYMLNAGDHVAARMAFKETYEKAVTKARNEGRPVKWWASLGHDAAGRFGPVHDAVTKGRLTAESAMRLLPRISYSERLQIENATAGDIAKKALEKMKG